jgi:transcriptional regulator with XRE-family HTH domain
MATDDSMLGATLRAWRDRIAPEAAGLPSRRGRRAKGLRREELAEPAGISVDYAVRLEQGRATRPSAQVVAALARALRLTELRNFARDAFPSDRPVPVALARAPVTVDCGVMTDGDVDRKIVVLTAAPGDAATRMRLAVVASASAPARA